MDRTDHRNAIAGEPPPPSNSQARADPRATIREFVEWWNEPESRSFSLKDDFLWYLSQRPPAAPNVTLLQNALDQTQGAGQCDAKEWRNLARDRLALLDRETVANDVIPFLERPEESLSGYSAAETGRLRS